MLTLAEIRQCVSDLDISNDENVYIGKLDNKKEKSIGIYSRPTSGNVKIPLGGIENASYDVKPVSLLVHWNKSKNDTEVAAYSLFEKLQQMPLNENAKIQFIRLATPEPQDVGTDDNGVYEYVIWIDVIYRKDR